MREVAVTSQIEQSDDVADRVRCFATVRFVRYVRYPFATEYCAHCARCPFENECFAHCVC